jgi:perosamine synthetase
VIEDAAHAIESSYRGRKIGHLSDTTCFSFYATKNITTGEGGMLTTNDETLAEQARMLSLHGISVDAWKRYRPGEYKHWDILSAGFKYNMFDLQACLGIHQLQRIETMWEARKQLTETYDEAFADMPAIQPLKQHDDVRSAYHLYAIQLNTAATSLSRDDLLMQLQERQIGVGVHFRPVHLHPYYRGKYGYAEGTFPVAEKAGDQLLSLPLFPSMTEQAQQYVIRTVKDILQHS